MGGSIRWARDLTDTPRSFHDAEYSRQNKYGLVPSAQICPRSSTVADFIRSGARTVEDAAGQHSFLYPRAAKRSRAAGGKPVEAGPVEERSADYRHGDTPTGGVAH